jgi:hypothetical protein
LILHSIACPRRDALAEPELLACGGAYLLLHDVDAGENSVTGCST